MLSILIVNYRSAELITVCLHSLFQFNQASDFEIIIVDNDSKDRSQEIIKKYFPQVNWIDMGYNAGFARANNAGIKAASGNIVLLLNPDTAATDDSISRCYQRLCKSSFIAAGIQLLNEDGTPQISGSFFVRGGLNHLLPIPYWGDFIRWIGYQTNSKIPHVEKAKEVEEVDWINGAFLMVKKEAIKKAGLMDEDFFLYSEEIEWCIRLKKKGKLAIFGDLHMIHLQGQSVNSDQKSSEKGYQNIFDRKGLQLMVSHHVRIRKQYGIFWFLFLLLNYTWGIIVFAIASTIEHLVHFRNPAKDWRKVQLFAKNVFVLWKLSPTILRNKPHFYKMF